VEASPQDVRQAPGWGRIGNFKVAEPSIEIQEMAVAKPL